MREAFTLHYIHAADCRAYFASLPKPFRPPAGSPLAKWLSRADAEHEVSRSDELTPMKRAAIIEHMKRRYPALESAIQRGLDWTKACRVPDRSGWYYLERIESECRARYKSPAPVPAAPMGLAAQVRSAAR